MIIARYFFDKKRKTAKRRKTPALLADVVNQDFADTGYTYPHSDFANTAYAKHFISSCR